jgi:uncharacterized membrane protein YkoI
MKNIFFVALAILCAVATGCAQKKVPAAVDSAFKTKFTNATNVSWNKENSLEYEAEFTMKGVKYSANFSNTGKWLETEQGIPYEELPELVKQSFTNSHKDDKLKAIAKIETSEGKMYYEIEVKKLLSSEEFFYDANGKELQDDDTDNDAED